MLAAPAIICTTASLARLAAPLYFHTAVKLVKASAARAARRAAPRALAAAASRGELPERHPLAAGGA
jgi:hypothetical protein